jgi:hypothetical protein
MGQNEVMRWIGGRQMRLLQMEDLYPEALLRVQYEVCACVCVIVILCNESTFRNVKMVSKCRHIQEWCWYRWIRVCLFILI